MILYRTSPQKQFIYRTFSLRSSTKVTLTLLLCQRLYCSASKSQKQRTNKRRENRFEYRALPYFPSLCWLSFFSKSLMLRLTATITNFFVTIKRPHVVCFAKHLTLMETNKWIQIVMETQTISEKQINRVTIWACIEKIIQNGKWNGEDVVVLFRIAFPSKSLRFVFVRSLFFGDALCESNFNEANLNFAPDLFRPSPYCHIPLGLRGFWFAHIEIKTY
jgi:hypothetical protein